MPAVNVSLLDGQLAWRQHDGGHTDGPNWKYFIPWADKFLKHAPGGQRERRTVATTDEPHDDITTGASRAWTASGLSSSFVEWISERGARMARREQAGSTQRI